MNHMFVFFIPRHFSKGEKKNKKENLVSGTKGKYEYTSNLGK